MSNEVKKKGLSAIREKMTLTQGRKAQGLSSMRLAMLVSVSALVVTKLVGLLRDILIVRKLSFGVLSDALYLGQSVPDLFYELFVGGALGVAITPFLSAAIEKDEEKEAWRPISTFFTLITILLFVMIVFGEFFIGNLIHLVSNAYHGNEVVQIATQVSRIVFLQTFFFLLISELGAVLNANKVFAVPSLGNTLYSLIGVAFLFIWGESSLFGVKMVSWGIVVGAVLYFAYFLFLAKPYLKHFRPQLHLRDPQFIKLLLIAAPALASRVLEQMYYLVQQHFTGQFEGSITALRQAATTMNMPYGIVVMGIGGMVLSNLSGFFARQAKDEASTFLSDMMRLTFYIIFPFTVVLVVLNFETIQGIYQWGSGYANENVAKTADLLGYYALLLPPLTLLYYYNQVFFALRKSWIMLVTWVVNFICNYLACTIYLNVFHLGLIGLPLAALSTYLVNIVVLSLLLRQQCRGLFRKDFSLYLAKVMAISVVTGLLLYGLFQFWPSVEGKLWQLIYLGVKAFLIFAVYVALTYLFKIPEAQKFLSGLRRKVNSILRRV